MIISIEVKQLFWKTRMERVKAGIEHTGEKSWVMRKKVMHERLSYKLFSLAPQHLKKRPIKPRNPLFFPGAMIRFKFNPVQM